MVVSGLVIRGLTGLGLVFSRNGRSRFEKSRIGRPRFDNSKIASSRFENSRIGHSRIGRF